jgi:hypothetical protein
VSWAGPGPAPVWLDAARDFSEYWTHHQQICDATRQPGLMSPGYARPVIDTFMRALPHTLHHVAAPEGTVLQMTVTGPGAGEWACTRDPDRWSLHRHSHPEPATRVELDTDTAWRLCTRGITPASAQANTSILFRDPEGAGIFIRALLGRPAAGADSHGQRPHSPLISINARLLASPQPWRPALPGGAADSRAPA